MTRRRSVIAVRPPILPSIIQNHRDKLERPSSSSSLSSLSGLSTPKVRPNFVKSTEMEEELLEYKEELEKRDEFIQGVQRNYQTLSALCAKNIKTIADLTSSLKQSKIELEEWKTNANAYMDAHQRVKIIEGKNTELLNKHTEYESELKGLNNKCYEYQIHIADLNDIKEDLTNQLHRTQQITHKKMDEIETLQKQINDEDVKKKLQDYRDANNELSQELFKSLEEVEYQKSCVKKVEVEMQKLKNVLRRAEMDRNNTMVDATRLKNSESRLKEDHDELKRRLLASKEEAANFELEVHRMRSQMKINNKRNPDTENKLKFAEEAMRTLQGQFDEAWNAKVEAEKQADEYRQQLSQQAKERQARMDRHTREARVLEDRLDDMRKEKNEAEESRLKLEGRLAQLEGEMEESDGQLKMYITKIHDLKKTNKQLEAEVSRNKTDIENASDTKLAVENARSQLAELKLKVRSQEVEITGLKEEKGKCRAEIKSLKHRLEHDVQARFEEMKNEYQSKINNLQKDIGTLNSKLMQEQHRNAEMSAIMDNSPQMTEHEIDMFRKKERELRATVAKLIVNEEASEASFTCFTCMDVFTDPVTCIPCGHSYCLKCIESAGKCVQCKDGSGGNVQYYKNELLDDLATRYSFRKQALASIKDMTAEKYSASKK